MNRPNMLTDTSFHRRSDSQGLVNPREVVVHMEQGNHSDVIVELLAERISQPSEAPHVHSHVEILSLNVAGADVFWIRVTNNVHTFGPKTLRRAVAPLSFRIAA